MRARRDGYMDGDGDGIGGVCEINALVCIQCV